MKPPKLIILLGTDGSGKSTVLSQILKSNLSIAVTHWKKLKSEKLNLVNPDMDLSCLKNEERFSYLYQYFALEKEIIETLLQKGANVIADGFYVKFLLKEILFKKLDIDLFHAINPFNGDEIYIFLDTDIKETYKRKEKITMYECFNDESDFIDFQSKLRKEIINYMKDKKYFIINGNQELNKVYIDTLHILKLVL